ncbi:hypothetical protein MNBD_GAMMA05-1320 [hydrothermal vent metagenome]|uniref:SPOR domain-containing protein n=1 Tax=hydrothermal vent metagenome TaxID=652676 RepID=A0A3B0W355_9ZZZZ
MAPILIDNRGLIKLGLISLLTVLAVFSAGYFSGYQKASVFYTATSEIENLVLPELNLVDISSTDSHSPEVILAGEEIDVDQPVVTPVLDVQNQNNKKDVAVINIANSLIMSPKKSVEINSSFKVIPQVSTESIQTSSSADDKANDIKKVDISSLTDDEINKIKYSVQVGMYGNLINAGNMVKILQAQQFDAYVVDYKNKKNEVRYNVRFGYFADKQAAITGLKRYKDVEKSDGYLVNFSIDNIVNLAGKNTIKDNIKPVSPIDVINESKPSKTDSSEITLNKLLQEKYLSVLQSTAH